MAVRYERITTKDHLGARRTDLIEITNETAHFIHGRAVTKDGTWTGTGHVIDKLAIENRERLAMDLHYGELVEVAAVCDRCGATTMDPDKWDPEVDTGRVLCDPCWNVEHP